MDKHQNHIQNIDLDIRRDFPQDPMMQKLHQIRRELTRNQSLEQVLRSIDRTTKPAPKTA